MTTDRELVEDGDVMESGESQETVDITLPQIREIAALLDGENVEAAREQCLGLHAADQAYLIDMLSSEQRARLLHYLDKDFDPQVLMHLEGDITEDVIEHLGVEEAAEVISQLDADDAVYILEELDEKDQQGILEAVPDALRQKVEEGLSYPEHSAGRLMHRRLVLIPEYWSVGNTIDFLRRQEQVPDEFYTVFVVDARNRPVGYVLLSQVIRSQRTTKIRELMKQDIRLIPTTMDQEEVAHLFRRYGVVSAPVVQGEGRVVGIITIKDVAEVIEDVVDEDLLRMGGVSGQDIFSALAETVRNRFPWLFVNLLTAILASMVIAQFEGSINQIVALAVLMPIIASMGGNAGTQSMTISVRALATRELTSVNAMRVIGKELLVGLANGLLFAVIAVGAVFAWYQDVMLAAVFAGATVVTLGLAGIAGTLIPLGLVKLRVDPAIASGVFLTTVTDVVGFGVFLGLAAWILL